MAPAYALISDYFPREQRARALSIYSFGIPIGSALGIVFGGFIASKIDWRFAFFAVGIAGIVLAPIFRLTVKEPIRGQFDGGPPTTPPPALREIMVKLRGKPSFWLISFGAACSSMMGYGVFFWLPSFFVRSYGLSLLDASLFFGAILLLAGILGIWLGGWTADRLGADRPKAYVVIPAVAFLATVPFYVIAVLSPDLTTVFVAMLLPVALGLAWLGPVLSTIQHLVPPNMRATASAIFLFINNLIGIGGGTFALGFISDNLEARYGDDSLRYAIVAGTSFYVLAAGLFLMSSKWLEADREAPAD